MNSFGVMGQVTTQSIKDVRNACGWAGRIRGGLLVIGPTGCGKTTLVESIVQNSGYALSVPEMISIRSRDEGYDFDAVMSLLRRLRLVADPPLGREIERVQDELFGDVPAYANFHRYRINIGRVQDWAERTVRAQRWPEADQARVLVQLGLEEYARAAPAIPIPIRARSTSSSSYLRSAFLASIHPGPMPPRTFDAERVIDEIARQLPILLLVDEADLLDEPALTLCREWNDLFGVGLVLLGTPVLLEMITGHRKLKPLADRMNCGVVKMGRPTLADLSECFPQFRPDIVSRIWQRAGPSFRVAHSIALGIQDSLERRPARVTRKLVDIIADSLPTAVHPKLVSRTPELPEDGAGRCQVEVEATADQGPVRAQEISRKRAAAR